MKAVKRYFKENIGILAALLVMIAFLCIYPRTASTFPTKNNIFTIEKIGGERKFKHKF